ncbi:MAG: hypothetical protein J6X18_16980, partial [Bacteroidales bacterium]|nr:hypothetical protein [Bacteroidales bacterium]
MNTVSPGTGADVENVGQNGEIVLDFDIPQGVKGNDAVNPFKGWFDSASDLMGGTIVANKGDYAYVKAVDANQQPIVKIYEYNASGTNNWTDSGRTFDPRNDVSFNSGQQLDAVAIDDTHLSNAVSSEETNAPMVPKASDTQLLKQKLRGIELEETKVVVDIDNVSQTQNAYDGFFVKVITNGTKGIITTGAITPVSNAVLCVPVNGYDRVRFLGMVYSSEPTYYSSGYGFCTNEPTIVNNNDTDVDIVYSFDVDTTLSDNEKREYVVDIPEGMNYFVCTIRKYNNDVMSLEEFYTYKEKGQTIQIVDNTNTKNSDSGFSSNQGMLLNSKVGEMLTLNEENVELQDGVNVFDGAIRTQNVTDTNESTISWKGYISNGITTYGTYASKYIEIDVENVEYVRFIGLVFKYYSITGLDSYIKSNGYAFYRTNEKGGDTHVETDNFLKGYTWDYDSSIDEDYCIKEYVIEVPSEAKIMRITCEISTFPELGKYFYCYKKFGFNCSDFLNDYQKNNSVEEFIEIDSAFISSGRLMRSNHKMQYVTGSYYRYCLINVSEGEIYKIVNDDARRYAFLRTTTFPTETGTSMEIVNGTIYFTTNNGESIITIPKGCKALYIDATSQGTDYIGFDLYKLIYEPINKNEINSINDSIVNYALTDAFIREKYFTQLPGTETTWVSINRNDYPNNPGIISNSTGKWGNSNLG